MSKKSFARLIRIVTGTFGSAKDELFSLEASLTRFEKFVHFWVLVVRSFIRNRCPIRASALSYTTMLAFIPMLAVAMSVSSALLKDKSEDQISAFIQQFITRVIPDDLSEVVVPEDAEWEMALGFGEVEVVTNANTGAVSTNLVGQATPPEAPAASTASLAEDKRVVAVKERAASQIRGFIQNASSGTLGVVGVLILMWTAIAMLTRVEETFNDIWGVTRGREWWPRISSYFTAMVFLPLLLIGALGAANSKNFQVTREALATLPLVSVLLSQVLPVLVISFTFACFYKVMPNTRVQWKAALAGGLLAGTSWYLFNLVTLQIGSRAVNASKIYGSLFLLPLLMAGLYAVWLIVLFGAQVAYAIQNRESYVQERLAENVNQRGREFVALRLMTCIGQHFHGGQSPATVALMARELGIPSKLVQQVLQTLLAAHLVVEVSGSEPGYSPARPLETITCHHILLAMRATQGQELVTREEPVREEVFGEFARIQAAEKAAATTVSMLALVQRADARLGIPAPAEPVNEPTVLTTETVTALAHEPAPAFVRATPTLEFALEKPLSETLGETREQTPPDLTAAPAPVTGRKKDFTPDEPSFPL